MPLRVAIGARRLGRARAGVEIGLGAGEVGLVGRLPRDGQRGRDRRLIGRARIGGRRRRRIVGIGERARAGLKNSAVLYGVRAATLVAMSRLAQPSARKRHDRCFSSYRNIHPERPRTIETAERIYQDQVGEENRLAA